MSQTSHFFLENDYNVLLIYPHNVMILNVRVHLGSFIIIPSFDSNLYRSKNNFWVYHFNRRTFCVWVCYNTVTFCGIDSEMSVPWDQAQHVPRLHQKMGILLDENK